MAAKTHIMKLAEVKLADELHVPSTPGMILGDNVLRMQHVSALGLSQYYRCFKMVKQLPRKFQVAWMEGEHSREVIKPSD